MSGEESTADDVMQKMVVACTDGDVKTVEMLLSGAMHEYWFEKRHGVEWKDKDGKDLISPSPVFVAIDYGRVDVVRYFLEKLTKKSVQENDDLEEGNEVSVSAKSEQLVADDHHPFKELKNENGYTMLHWASFVGYLDIAKLLVEVFGSQIIDQEAIDLAKDSGFTEISTFLLERVDLYTDLKEADDGDGGLGHAIMLRACQFGDLATVRKLINEGYDYKHWRIPDDEDSADANADSSGASGNDRGKKYQQY